MMRLQQDQSMNALAIQSPVANAPDAGAASGAVNAQLRSVMSGLRELCVSRGLARIDERSSLFTGELEMMRASSGSRRRLDEVSIALDEFVADVRTVLDMVKVGQPEVHQRVEKNLDMLNQMFVAGEESLSVGTGSPQTFMLGAETAVLNVSHWLRRSRLDQPDQSRGDQPPAAPRMQ